MARDSNTVVAKIGIDDSGFQEGASKIQRSLKNEVKTKISGIIEGLKSLLIVKNVLEVIKNTINVAINILKGNWQGSLGEYKSFIFFSIE